MKILKHGTYLAKTPPIRCTCGRCQCELEIEENEIEGNASRFVWCPECREAIYLNPLEIVQAVRG